MSKLDLKLEHWDAFDTPASEWADEVPEKGKKGEYSWAATTDFRGTSVFKILDDFVQPNTETDIYSAASSIFALLPKDAPLSTEVSNVGDIFLEVAGQVPYHHPSQAKLARLMERLMLSSKFRNGPKNDDFGRGQRLDETLLNAFNGPSMKDPQEWPNLMAFYAHLYASHIYPHDPSYAIQTMRDTFEHRPVPWAPDFEGERDQRIIAAAQWILWDGIELFKDVLSPDSGNNQECGLWQPGLLCFSEHRLDLRRWNFWKEGFQKAAGEDSGRSAECRKVARKAANLMVAIQESLTF